MPETPASEATNLPFFEGFAWALPRAFAPALSDFRFEQGDVLYPDPAAYAASGAAVESGLALQILQPKRSARALATEGDASRRETSWTSEVELEQIDLAEGSAETLRTSQGRLVMWLWSGDATWLDPERAAPPLPLAARELASRLEQAEGTFDDAFRTRKGSRFLFVVDEASDASRVKAQTVEEALAAVGRIERIDRPVAHAGIEEAEAFLPTLRVRGIAVAGASEAALESALRGVLYGGASTATEAASDETDETDVTDHAPSTDRFSVARHGRLAALGRTQSPPEDG